MARKEIPREQIPAAGNLTQPDTTSEATPTNACALPKDRGPCDRYNLRFYFNRELNECKYFFYGGCEGNANNFERVEDCERTCGAAGATPKTLSPSSAAPPPTTRSFFVPTTSDWGALEASSSSGGAATEAIPTEASSTTQSPPIFERITKPDSEFVRVTAEAEKWCLL